MKREMKKVLITSMIGNALEWYDFVLFVQFAPFIAQLFFPSHDPQASLLAVFGVFAAGFIMRPIGGIIFGYIGDKLGRKTSVILPILIMSVPTAMIGFLPTYEQIGVAAPILLTIIRLLQGIALGGGFSGCMTFLVEHSPLNIRGFVGSTSMFSLGAGVLVGIVITMICSSMMSEGDFQIWGWRIPFIISIAIGMVAFYIKNHVHESPVYLQAKEHGKLSKAPIRDVFSKYRKELLIAIGMYLTVTVPFYTFSAYFNSFMIKKMHFTLYQAMGVNGVAMFVLMIFILISGVASDKFGRKRILFIAASLMLLVCYPVFSMLSSGLIENALLGQIIFAIVLGTYMGPIPAVLVESFPTSVRFTGLALSYNFSAALFGGTAPYVYELLIKHTNTFYAPAFYIVCFVFISVISLFYYKDKSKIDLEE